ncbi:MAG: glycosyl hydrolase family 59, partial [Ruminiclostridium sp.]
DQGGAFEVQKTDDCNVLMQMITPDIKANEWGGTPDPTTCFGDDRWYNYSISADVKLENSEDSSKNYAGIGLRYNLGCLGASGYHIQLWENGTWKLLRNGKVLETGSTDADVSGWVSLKLTAENDTITAFIGDNQVCEYKCSEAALLGAGRGALYSSYNRNCFDNLKVEAIGDETYVTRFDNTDSCVEYSGEWEQETISSFKNYKRSIATGSEGGSVTFKFNGTGFGVTGVSKTGTIKVEVDGAVVESDYEIPKGGFRQTYYYMYGLEKGEHTAVITVNTGNACVDSFEVYGSEVPMPKEEAEEEVVDVIDETTTEVTTAAENNSTETTESTDKADNEESTVNAESKSEFPVGLAVGIGVGAAAVIAAVVIIIAKKKKK